MYAGALFEKFGVKMLIDAFIEIEGDYEEGNDDVIQDTVTSSNQ
jgi:hypothetical protein